MCLARRMRSRCRMWCRGEKHCDALTLALPTRSNVAGSNRSPMVRNRHVPGSCYQGSASLRLAKRFRACRGGYRMALVVGLVSLAVIWLVVIYGSIYVNKNVQ